MMARTTKNEAMSRPRDMGLRIIEMSVAVNDVNMRYGYGSHPVL
jgi:hypothetical protein